MSHKINNGGFSLVELLVAIAFVSVITLLITIFGSFNTKVWKINEERTRAAMFASQALEVVELFPWEDLDVGDYHPEFATSSWSLVSGSELLENKYTRVLTIGNVYRASSTNTNVHGPIVDSGGFFDPDTKKLTATITWQSPGGGPQTYDLETYRHNWMATRWEQTDWQGGSGQEQWADETRFWFKDSGIENDTPGILTLVSGYIDWTFATTTAIFDTPGNFDDTDVDEKDFMAYLVTRNNPSGAEFYILDVSNPNNPVLRSSIDIGSSVSSVTIVDDYAYISTGDNSGEFQIVNVADPYNPFVESTRDLVSNDDASDASYDNVNKVYIGQNQNLHAFDVADSSNPIYLGFVNIGANIEAVFATEDYVYLATDDAAQELQIVDAANPLTMFVTGGYDLAGSVKGSDVVVLGNRVYIGTDNSGSSPEFYIFDASDRENPVFLGDYEVNEKVWSLSVIGPYILMGTNFLNQELVVLDIADPLNIGQIAVFDIEGYVLGQNSNCSIIYAATSSNQGEFFVISTNVVDCQYAQYGELESSIYDTGSDKVVYNWITYDGEEPEATDIRFQIATSNNPSGPWNYVGPNGTNTDYYTSINGELINYNFHKDQRYIRYKVFLTSEADLTAPILERVVISYSVYF